MADSKQTALTSTLEQVISAAQALPAEKNLLAIRREAELASARGYYLPDEDDRLRVVYSDYLVSGRNRFKPWYRKGRNSKTV